MHWQVPASSDDVSVSFLWNDEGSLSVKQLGNGSSGAAPQVSPLSPAHEWPAAPRCLPSDLPVREHAMNEVQYPETARWAAHECSKTCIRAFDVLARHGFTHQGAPGKCWVK